MRRAARVDTNHPEIVKAFTRLGFSVLNVSQLKNCCDLFISKGKTATAAIEIKDGTKPKSKRKLTDGEAGFRTTWKGLYFIVESIDDVLKVVKELSS